MFTLHERLDIINLKEEQILLPALERFTEITGIEVRILRTSDAKKGSIDAILEIIRDNQNYIVEVEVKSEIRTAALTSILGKQKTTDGKLLMVSRYIPVPMKDALKAHGISYIEGSGNCYIETRRIYM